VGNECGGGWGADPSTTVFPAGRTCVLGAESRGASGLGFSGSTVLLRFVQSSGLCSVSSISNPCSPGRAVLGKYFPRILTYAKVFDRHLQAILISFSNLWLSVFRKKVRHKISVLATDYPTSTPDALPTWVRLSEMWHKQFDSMVHHRVMFQHPSELENHSCLPYGCCQVHKRSWRCHFTVDSIYILPVNTTCIQCMAV